MVTRKQLEKKYRESEARQKRQVTKLSNERNVATGRYTKKINAIINKESRIRSKLFKQMQGKK